MTRFFRMLAARDARWQRRFDLCSIHRLPVLSLTLRVPYKLRVSSRMRKLGEEFWNKILQLPFPSSTSSRGPLSIYVRYNETEQTDDGFQAFAALLVPVKELKLFSIHVETDFFFGPLIDLDVMEAGVSQERANLGFPPRKCLVCDHDAKECSSRCTHSLEETEEAVRRILAGVRL